MDGITVAGTLIEDVIYTVEKYPSLGLLASISETKYSIGGSCTISVALAKIDPSLQVRVSGVIGNDTYGADILENFHKYPNIETKYIVQKEEPDTSLTVVINATEDLQRTFFHKQGVNSKLDICDLSFEPSKIFHLEYLLLMDNMDSYDEEYGTKSARALKMAKDKGMITSIDVVSESPERFEKCALPALKYTDVCIVNEEEAYGITGIKLTDLAVGGEEALLKIQALGVSKWVVIHTPKLCYGLDCETGKIEKIPGKQVPRDYIKGTTGAGDAYCTGILYGLYQDKSLLESMKIANVSAVNSLSALNGTDGIKEYEVMAKIYEEL